MGEGYGSHSADASWGGTDLPEVRSWSFEVEMEVAEYASSDTDGWRERDYGVKSWSAEVSCANTSTGFIGTDILANMTSSQELILQDGQKQHQGNALCTGISFEVDLEGSAIVGTTLSFVGDGQIQLDQTMT